MFINVVADRVEHPLPLLNGHGGCNLAASQGKRSTITYRVSAPPVELVVVTAGFSAWLGDLADFDSEQVVGGFASDNFELDQAFDDLLIFVLHSLLGNDDDLVLTCSIDTIQLHLQAACEMACPSV